MLKKVFIYFFAFVFICFILPALLTRRITTASEVSDQIEENKEENANSEYIYNKYGTIKLLHTDTNAVEEVALYTYICHVVSTEIPMLPSLANASIAPATFKLPAAIWPSSKL